MNSTTQPSEGAVRAASRIKYGQLLPDNCLNDEAMAFARIIEQETGVGELVEALIHARKLVASRDVVLDRAALKYYDAALSRHTSTQGKEGKL
jgi:hypothetical protein